MDFNRELLARLEAAQLGSPALLGAARSLSADAELGGGPSGSAARRALFHGPASDYAGGGSPGSSSGLQTPRSCGLLEALLTSDGSPHAAATARAAACAALAATASSSPRGSPHSSGVGSSTGSVQGTSRGGTHGPWQELPADVWRWVVADLSPADVKAALLVCAAWRAALSRNVQLLRPRQMKCQQVAVRWVLGAMGVGDRGAAALRVSRAHIRSGLCRLPPAPALFQLPSPHLQLPRGARPGAQQLPAAAGATELHATPAAWPPWRSSLRCSHLPLALRPLLASQLHRIYASAPPSRPKQDWDLLGLPLLGTLRHVSLKGCEGVTDDGVARLAALPRLERLSLRNCIKLTDVGLAKLAGLAGRELPQLWAPAGPAGGAGSPPPVPLLRSPIARGGLLGPAAAAGGAAPPQRRAPPLASLDLAGCVLLTERGFAAMASGLGGSLTELLIGGCSRVSTVGDAALEALARCAALRRLDLSGCTHISDEGVLLFGGGGGGDKRGWECGGAAHAARGRWT